MSDCLSVAQGHQLLNLHLSSELLFLPFLKLYTYWDHNALWLQHFSIPSRQTTCMFPCVLYR